MTTSNDSWLFSVENAWRSHNSQEWGQKRHSLRKTQQSAGSGSIGGRIDPRKWDYDYDGEMPVAAGEGNQLLHD